MYIVRLSGGLGNQMFQYAVKILLERNNKKVFFDLECFHFEVAHNGLELFDIFNITVDNTLKKDLEIFSKREKKIDVIYKWIKKFSLDSFISKWKLRHILPYKINRYNYPKINIGEYTFLEVLNLENHIFQGTEIDPIYLDNIRTVLLRDFSFKKVLDEKNKKILNEIRNSNSVSIHIRRGDYAKESYFEILPFSYYEKSIEYVRSKRKDLVFYIFTDDPSWAESKFVGENYIIVNINSKENSFLDMLLMSNCKINIIANSTFSWWGAYLNTNVEKLVLCPNTFLNIPRVNDIYPKNWIRIE